MGSPDVALGGHGVTSGAARVSLSGAALLYIALLARADLERAASWRRAKRARRRFARNAVSRGELVTELSAGNGCAIVFRKGLSLTLP
jgi:hypothetical protein